MDEPAAPGWDAIDAALARVYGGAVPRHVGYFPPAALSANLQGCSAYRARGHWHFVSYGLSELWAKDAEADPAVSGWGFELTLRVPAADGEAEAPAWAFTVINEMAKHVNRGSPLAPGDRLDLNAAVTGHPQLAGAPATGLTVFAVALDPELGTIATPNGQVGFLQLVGVTAGEKARMLEHGSDAVLAELRATEPLLLTDPRRA